MLVSSNVAFALRQCYDIHCKTTYLHTCVNTSQALAVFCAMPKYTVHSYHKLGESGGPVCLHKAAGAPSPLTPVRVL